MAESYNICLDIGGTKLDPKCCFPAFNKLFTHNNLLPFL